LSATEGRAGGPLVPGCSGKRGAKEAFGSEIVNFLARQWGALRQGYFFEMKHARRSLTATKCWGVLCKLRPKRPSWRGYSQRGGRGSKSKGTNVATLEGRKDLRENVCRTGKIPAPNVILRLGKDTEGGGKHAGLIAHTLKP